MARKALKIKSIKRPKVSKFKLPKPVSKQYKVKSTAGKQTKSIKIGGKVYKSTTTTRGLTNTTGSRSKTVNITNKGTISEPKSQRVSY